MLSERLGTRQAYHFGVELLQLGVFLVRAAEPVICHCVEIMFEMAEMTD